LVIGSKQTALSDHHDGGHAWDRVLPTGNYRIEFDGTWVEDLKIAVKDGKLTQSIRVVGFGGKLLLEEQN
jgi:major membrane immunogen (membrane-anchored lipoprotein)